MLWGKDTHESEDILKQELKIGKGNVANQSHQYQAIKKTDG